MISSLAHSFLTNPLNNPRPFLENLALDIEICELTALSWRKFMVAA
jgi:hypothetical protein